MSKSLGFLRFLSGAILLGFSTCIGCTTDSPGRMQSYLGPFLGAGTDAPRTSTSERLLLPPGGLKAKLLVVNDTTDPKSAPPLSQSRLALMVNLVRESLEQDLPIQVVEVFPISDIPTGESQINVIELARGYGVDHVVLAVLSSQDEETPTHIGQGFMMTEMPGLEVVNYALVEMALLDVRTGRLIVQAKGQGSELIQELDVPIGADQPSKAEVRDILRINAAKKALDRTMVEFDKLFAEVYQAKN